jgi:hypothetical protein
MANLNDLEAAIGNRLQEKENGQTVLQLSDYLEEPEGTILTMLYALQKESYVKRSEQGVWTLVLRRKNPHEKLERGDEP